MGHEGEIAHEDFLFLDLLRLLVPQADLDLQRRGVGSVPGFAFLYVVLRLLVHFVVNERQLQVALVVGNCAHIREDFPQAGLQEFLIGGLLNLQQVRHGNNFFVTGKVLAKGFSIILVFCHLHIHLSSAP